MIARYDSESESPDFSPPFPDRRNCNLWRFHLHLEHPFPSSRLLSVCRDLGKTRTRGESMESEAHQKGTRRFEAIHPKSKIGNIVRIRTGIAPVGLLCLRLNAVYRLRLSVRSCHFLSENEDEK